MLTPQSCFASLMTDLGLAVTIAFQFTQHSLLCGFFAMIKA